MEGKTPNAVFDHQATDPRTKGILAHQRLGDRWIVRDDVRFLDRKRPQTLGEGSRDRTGAEFEFGLKHCVADVRKDLNTPRLPFVIQVIG